MESSPLICHANQWTCFYMTGNIVIELTNVLIKVTNVSFVSKHASIMPVFNKGYRGSVDCRDSVDNLKSYCVSILTLFMG